jgi:hypothetical protein
MQPRVGPNGCQTENEPRARATTGGGPPADRRQVRQKAFEFLDVLLRIDRIAACEGNLVPSAQHEMTLQLLRDAPDVLGRILRAGFGIEVGQLVTEGSTAFAELTAPAYAADLVLVGDVVLGRRGAAHPRSAEAE